MAYQVPVLRGKGLCSFILLSLLIVLFGVVYLTANPLKALPVNMAAPLEPSPWIMEHEGPLKGQNVPYHSLGEGGVFFKF